VELNPNINARIGLKFLHNRFSSSLLYSITSSQFSDAQNTILPSTNALFGEIPAYSVVDFSSKYSFREFALEFGINNLLDASYFTRRASGYPGPGIIPSDRRNFYCSFQYSL
jgi:Fe(3+) dicitrate transport protein